MDKVDFLRLIEKQLIVSCQALENEPLHGSNHMAKMAAAAIEGGAIAIRANGPLDIEAIKEMNQVPVIGLLKRDYEDSNVYITPTIKEVEELLEAKPEVIAIDATCRVRPGNVKLKELIDYIHEHDTLVLADISTLNEGLLALELGADILSTTLSGYTDYTQYGLKGPDLNLVYELCEHTDAPVLAEGRINTPEEAKALLEIGAFAVIVGSAITRPQLITRKFVDAIKTINV